MTNPPILTPEQCIERLLDAAIDGVSRAKFDYNCSDEEDATSAQEAAELRACAKYLRKWAAVERPVSKGELLRRYRRALGLTMGDVARHLGVSVVAVSDLERGVKP